MGNTHINALYWYDLMFTQLIYERIKKKKENSQNSFLLRVKFQYY